MELSRRMLLMGLSLPLSAAFASRRASAAPSATEVARRVQSLYDGTSTFRARFEQRYRMKAQDIKKLSHGTLAFAKPLRLSFRYSDPEGNRVVSDGKLVLAYEKAARQLVRTRVIQSQYPAALAFLMGEGKLLRDFELRLLDVSDPKAADGHVLLATPKKPAPAYAKLLMYLEAPTFEVRRMLIVDAQGNHNRFDFREVILNKKIPAAEFRFTPPPGTKIVQP